MFFFYRQMSGAHPITGIIVLVLSVIQPIAAAFRPHPGDDKYVFFITFKEFRDVVRAIDCCCSLIILFLLCSRYLFNWAHRAGGIFALILAGTISSHRSLTLSPLGQVLSLFINLRSNSDQHKFSPDNIDTQSRERL